MADQHQGFHSDLTLVVSPVQTIPELQRPESKCCLYTAQEHFSSKQGQLWSHTNSISSNKDLPICPPSTHQHLFCRTVTIAAAPAFNVHICATQRKKLRKSQAKLNGIDSRYCRDMVRLEQSNLQLTNQILVNFKQIFYTAPEVNEN